MCLEPMRQEPQGELCGKDPNRPPRDLRVNPQPGSSLPPLHLSSQPWLTPWLPLFPPLLLLFPELKKLLLDLPGAAVAKNLPSNAADLIPTWGTKIPYTSQQASLHTALKEST